MIYLPSTVIDKLARATRALATLKPVRRQWIPDESWLYEPAVSRAA